MGRPTGSKNKTNNPDIDKPFTPTGVKAASAGPEPSKDESEEARWARIGKRRDGAKAAKTKLGSLGEQKLVAPTREGFRRYWANDDGNRLANMLNKGYDFVRKGSEGSENVFSTDPGDRISQLVGMTKTGEPMRAYLMEIPEGWYLEDQQQKEDNRREIDKQLKRAAVGGESGIGSSTAYVPTRGPSHFDV